MPLVGSIDTAKKLQIFRQYFVKKDKGLPDGEAFERSGRDGSIKGPSC